MAEAEIFFALIISFVFNYYSANLDNNRNFLSKHITSPSSDSILTGFSSDFIIYSSEYYCYYSEKLLT